MPVPLHRFYSSVLNARGGGFGMLQTGLVQVGVTGVNIATGIITARLLGPIGRGEVGAALIWLTLPAQLATAGLQSGIVFLIRRDPERASSLTLAASLIALTMFVPIAAICWLVIPYALRAYTHEIIQLARFASMVALLSAGLTIARGSLLGSRNVHLFNVSMGFVPLTYLALLVVMLPAGALTPAGTISAQVLATTFGVGLTVWLAVKVWHRSALRPFSVVSDLARFSGQAAGTDLVAAFYSNVDRLLLVRLIAPEDFGLYAVASSFARLVYICQTSVSSVILADLASCDARDIEAYVHRTIRLLFWLLLSACVLGWFGGGLLLRGVYGERFDAAIPIFRILLVEASLSCLAQVLVEAFLSAGRPRFPTQVQILYCLVLSVALLLLAPRYGAVGAAWAMLGAVVAKLSMLLDGLWRIDLGLPGLTPTRGDLNALRRFWQRLRSAPVSDAPA